MFPDRIQLHCIMQKTVQTFFIEEIGKVILKRSTRSRSLRIRVNWKEGVTVIMPPQISETTALRFVREKKNWIAHSLKRQEKIKKQSTVFNETSCFTTRSHTLHLLKHNKNTVKSIVSGNKIVVWYPAFADVEDSRIQLIIRRVILEAWRVEAKLYLPGRVALLAKQFNYKYNKLMVKNTKTRWGSCSAKNNINLNLQLMRLPNRLIDYIILHELTHTVHKNHHQTFWDRMESIVPGARKFDKELNTYHLEYW